MLQDGNVVMQAAERLKDDDFYQPAHREIYNCMLALYRQQMNVDVVTVDSELSRRGTLEGIGGIHYLTDLIEFVPTTANSRAYISLVLETSTLRKLITASQQIQRDAYTRQDTLPDILAHAEKSIFDIVMNRSGGEALIPIREVLFSTMDHIEEQARYPGQLTGVPTGYTVLDELLTGMHGGELILIGARPSMGKTSFAMNIAGHAALNAGKTVAVFSLEMPREQIAQRILCSDARVDMQKVRRGTLSQDDWVRLARSIGPMANAKLFIDDTAGISPSTLRSRCRRLMMDHGLDLIIVDYLGLMHADSNAENRQLEVSEISRSLKAIAKELNVPLIACAQLSRAAANRPDKRPILSDLRDSGSIEQDADVVMFIHREAYYNPDCEEKNIGEIILAKQRNGPLGTVKLAWLAEYTTYANLAPGSVPGGDAPF